MTRDHFLRELAESFILKRPEVLTANPPLYPRGCLIRVKVLAPWDTVVPPLADPIQLVWLARNGRLRGVNQAYLIATAGLGLAPLDAMDLIEASDKPPEQLTPKQRAWRVGILDILEAYRTDLEGAKVGGQAP